MPPRDPFSPTSTTAALKARSSSMASTFSVHSSGADFCKGLPKAELHLHVEGSLEPEHMFALAQRNNISLTYPNVAAVRDAYQFANLQEFLDLYYQGTQVLLHEQDFEDLLYAYLQRASADGVVRAEVFTDPQSHLGRGIPFATFMGGFEKAIHRAESDFGISTAIIICFLRHLPVEDAWKAYEKAQPYISKGLIIGVGLDSTEMGNPNERWKDVFAAAKQAGLHCVAHAGEEGPPSYVTNTLDHLPVERIDHGVRSEEDPVLLQRLVDQQIPLTVCPFSNYCLKVIDKLEDCNLKRMLEKGVKVSIHSDDPAYFSGYIAENYRATAEALDLSVEQMVAISRNSIEASFATSEQKAAWLRQLDEYVQSEAPKLAVDDAAAAAALDPMVETLP